jgi:hypothetical protein
VARGSRGALSGQSREDRKEKALDAKRMKSLERELRRKEKALAEAATATFARLSAACATYAVPSFRTRSRFRFCSACHKSNCIC